MIAPTSAPLDIAHAVRLAPESAEDGGAVDALIDQAFGPGRFAKTAERLREGAPLRGDVSVCAWSAAELIGSVRLWEIQVGGSDGLFLGPIAVRAAERGRGLGGAMVARACEAARAADEAWVMLVGARSFFEPLGFEAAAPTRVVLPGPIDSARLLWRRLRADAASDLRGEAGRRGDDLIVRTPNRPAKLPSRMQG